VLITGVLKRYGGPKNKFSKRRLKERYALGLELNSIFFKEIAL